MKSPHVFILAIGFLPNIGGLETHLKDLIKELNKENWKVTVLTYQPLFTPVLGEWVEKAKNLVIYRLPVLRGIFYKLYKIPVLEFLFLEPLFFIMTPLVLIRHSEIHVINAQGLIAGFTACFWSKVFRKRYVVSAQSVYNFPRKGLYRNVCKWIFKSADKVIAISKQTKKDIETLGVESDKIIIYTNWEDSSIFVPTEKKKAKIKVGFSNAFVVSFFARLVEEKGVKVLIEAIKLSDKRIIFAVYGEGPLKGCVISATKTNKNIKYMGIIPPELLPLHYSAADIVIMPSLHEEGFGRVAAGALLCGTPVIASNRGALPEVVSIKVGKIIEPTPRKISICIDYLYSHKLELNKMALKARVYAISKFNSRNAKTILNSFMN